MEAMAVMHDESVDEPADDMISMRQVVVDGRYGGDLGSSLVSELRGRRFFHSRRRRGPSWIPARPSRPSLLSFPETVAASIPKSCVELPFRHADKALDDT